jgi:hypothetical protein
MTRCTIDQAVLAAEKAGDDWQTVRDTHSHRQFLRVLRRARRRAAHWHWTTHMHRDSGNLSVAPTLVLHRTDGAHRRMVYWRSRQSRLHLNLIIKNGERVSLRGAFGAPRIYRAAGFVELLG